MSLGSSLMHVLTIYKTHIQPHMIIHFLHYTLVMTMAEFVYFHYKYMLPYFVCDAIFPYCRMLACLATVGLILFARI